MKRRTRRGGARVAALGLGLALGELVLRLLGVSYPVWHQPTPGLGEWGIPHAEGWNLGETRIWVKLNAEGARDVDHFTAKPDDTLRIVVVGDSFSAAFEVEREQTWWSVTEQELVRCESLRRRRVEVINISKRGYGTTEELLALRRFGMAYDPDWVVLAFFSGNDVRNNSKALKRTLRPYFVYEGSEFVLDESYLDLPEYRRQAGEWGRLQRFVLRHSRLAQTIRQVARQLEARLDAAEREIEITGGAPGLDDGVYVEPRDPAWALAWRITEDVIRRMRDEAGARGARFLLMTLSNPIQVNPDRELRESFAERIGVSNLFYPERRLRGFAEREGIVALVLAPEILRWSEENERCAHGFGAPWLCRGHWNESGHAYAGRRLAETICRELARGE